MLFSFNYEMLLSGGDVYLKYMNEKLIVYCEWGHEGIICEDKLIDAIFVNVLYEVYYVK